MKIVKLDINELPAPTLVRCCECGEDAEYNSLQIDFGGGVGRSLSVGCSACDLHTPHIDVIPSDPWDPAEDVANWNAAIDGVAAMWNNNAVKHTPKED